MLEDVLSLTAVARTEARWPHPPRPLRLAGSRRTHAAHGGPTLRSNSGVFSTIRPGWRTAASWTFCAASKAKRSPCAADAERRFHADRRHRRRYRAADGTAAVYPAPQADNRRSGARSGDVEIDASALYSQVVVDKAAARPATSATPCRIARRSRSRRSANVIPWRMAWPNWSPICNWLATSSRR